MIVNATYFQGDTHIAQKATPAVLEKLNLYISKYEPAYLQTVLGYALYKAFNTGLQLDPIPAKWVRLRDGGEYTNRYGYLAKWAGFSDIPTTPITNYIYWQFVRSESKYLVGSGAVEAKTENAKRVSPAELQVRAWNEMVEGNRNLAAFIVDNPDDYGEYGPYYYHSYYCHAWNSDFCHTGTDSRYSMFQTTNAFGI